MLETAFLTTSGGLGGSFSSSEASYMLSAAQYANIMVEYSNEGREVPIDVPASFIAQAKTPPRYPPPPSSGPVSFTPAKIARKKLYSQKMESSPKFLPKVEPPKASSRSSKSLEKKSGRHRENLKKPAPPKVPSTYSSKTPATVGQDTTDSKQKDEVPSDGIESRTKTSKEQTSTKEQTGVTSAGALRQALDRLAADLPQHGQQLLGTVGPLLDSPGFQAALATYARVQERSMSSVLPAPAERGGARQTAEAVCAAAGADNESATSEEQVELARILRRPEVGGLLACHDALAEMEPEADLEEEEEIMQHVDRYSEPNIKVVKLRKTQEPLGATIKNNGSSVIVGRIIRGGAAERSGLLHEGDELLEVNGNQLRGRTVNDVCDLLSSMKGDITLLVVPSPPDVSESLDLRQTLVHLKAMVDYDAEEDMYIPCREIGISYTKSEILHVINQSDPNWWQAYREGDENCLAGMIPSAAFQERRLSLTKTISDDIDTKNKKHADFLCAKMLRKKKFQSNWDNLEIEESCTIYEEVELYYPRPERKRPVVLIGPPNIGRHQLRERLLEDTSRFSVAIPHTSRPRRNDEQKGIHYHFISRVEFETDIRQRKFVEHGEYEKYHYGTSLQAIRSVVQLGKICVLNLHPQSLPVLRKSDLMPYVVFVSPPSLLQLKRWKLDHNEAFNEDELEDTIERARTMEEKFGHYFDLILTHSDPDKAYHQLLTEINSIEREPQWVPAAWVRSQEEEEEEQR